MAMSDSVGLWRFSDDGLGKYLVTTKLDDAVFSVPSMVWGARDPAVPAGLRSYVKHMMDSPVVGYVHLDMFTIRRRDGSIPDWPFVVISAHDPHSVAALNGYADAAAKCGFDTTYVEHVRRLAAEFARAFDHPVVEFSARAWTRDVMDATSAVLRMSRQFEEYARTAGAGDPDAPRHRQDDPATIARMKFGRSA